MVLCFGEADKPYINSTTEKQDSYNASIGSGKEAVPETTSPGPNSKERTTPC